jgi:hypothetical protein
MGGNGMRNKLALRYRISIPPRLSEIISYRLLSVLLSILVIPVQPTSKLTINCPHDPH